MTESFIFRFFKRPPIVFPILALFLAFLTVYEMVNWWGDWGEVHNIYMLRPLLMLGFTTFWCVATLLKKWGAVAFIVLTVLSFSLALFGKDNMWHRSLHDVMFPGVPLHAFMCVLLLVFFKKMD